jgi:hypothetical protein
MSPRVLVLRDGEEEREGFDVIIDARDTPQFFDVIILSGKELRSVVATGSVSGGVPIGIGKYTKRTVAAVVGGKIYIKGRPLSLYEEAGLLEKELSEILNKTGMDTDAGRQETQGSEYLGETQIQEVPNPGANQSVLVRATGFFAAPPSGLDREYRPRDPTEAL